MSCIGLSEIIEVHTMTLLTKEAKSRLLTHKGTDHSILEASPSRPVKPVELKVSQSQQFNSPSCFAQDCCCRCLGFIHGRQTQKLHIFEIASS